MCKSDELSIFEKLIGENMNAFHMMIEGALKNWEGTYDVILLDKREYLLKAKNRQNFNPYCRFLRDLEGGEDLCLSCDLNAAFESGNHVEDGWVHLCDGGLIDVAAPIIIDGNVVAAILCGQARPNDPSLEEVGRRQTLYLEQTYGIEDNELLKFRECLPSVTIHEMEEMSKRLARMTGLVSQLLSTQLDIQNKKKQLEQVSKAQAAEIDQLRFIEEALTPLLTLQSSLDELWDIMDSCLKKVATLLNAMNAALLLYNKKRTSELKSTLQAISFMPPNLNRGISVNNDKLFENWQNLPAIFTSEFTGEEPCSVCQYLENFQINEAIKIQSFLIIKIGFASEDTLGLLIFFFEEDKQILDSHLDQQMELTLIATNISQAYNNTIAFIQQVEESKQRQNWIKRIEHQLISPLNGVMGHAGRLKDRFDDLRSSGSLEKLGGEEIIGWQNNFNSLIDTTEWAVTLTRNLTWMADPESSRQAITQAGLNLISDVPAYLIECARYFQGIARDYRLIVHVDTISVVGLNNRLRIYGDYFKMALQNLLDNAVKYSTRGTEVLVDGEATNGHGRIRVINSGLRLFPDECERIFNYGYRSNTARRQRKAGTGIGLSIAQEIIRIHGGAIKAEPSEFINGNWRTTVTIVLPILPTKGH